MLFLIVLALFFTARLIYNNLQSIFTTMIGFVTWVPYEVHNLLENFHGKRLAIFSAYKIKYMSLTTHLVCA